MKIMHPDKKQIRIAPAAPIEVTNGCIMSAMMAVGPTLRSLQLPKRKYTKQPMKPL